MAGPDLFPAKNTGAASAAGSPHDLFPSKTDLFPTHASGPVPVAANGATPAGPVVQQHHSGGFLGSVTGALKSAGHFVAEKSALAGHDLASIPGGVVGQVKGLGSALESTVEHPWISRQKGEEMWAHPFRVVPGTANTPQAVAQAKGVVQGAVHSVEHPLADPFQTLMTVLPAAHFVGEAGLRGIAASDAVKAGEGAKGVAKAAVTKAPIKPRLLRSGNAEVPLQPSSGSAMRLAQHGYDKVLQHALDTNPEGRIAAHAEKRIGGSLDETARYQQRMHAAPSAALEQAAKRLSSKTSRGEGRMNQAALELASTNTPADVAAKFHLDQAAKGVSPERNTVVAKLYQTVHDRGMLTTNEHGDVIVNAQQFPKLAHADLRLAQAQGRGDEILARYGIRTSEALQAAVDAPGKYRAGATYEKPTPGKLGLETPGLKTARQRVVSLQGRIDRAAQADQAARDQGLKSALELKGPMRFWARTPQQQSQLRGAVAVAQGDLARNERAAANRITPTGVVGGETARPGRGHVSYASAEKAAPMSPVAASPGPVVGEARSPITSHANTGYNIQHGLVPEDVTGQASRKLRSVLRFANTTDRRNAAIQTGSDVRRSSRDVLVRVPGEEHAKIPQVIEETLGRKRPTVDQIDGLNAALDAYRADLVPGLTDNFALDKNAPVGQTAAQGAAERGLDAPDGYKWVSRHALGELTTPARGSTNPVVRSITHGVDNLNTAVTAATVYFKLGHIPTRYVTNAVTNIIQGSATPANMAWSNTLWRSLSDTDKARALAASGQHAYSALPMTEGTGAISRFISGKGHAGAMWWAKHADAPFRFNSIAYEARKAGFDTPQKFSEMLDRMERPHDFNMSAADAAKVDWVAKRANREGIAYDRLNDFEKRYVTRAFWFYPWTAGAARFAVNTALEHPFKAAALGTLGVQGRKTQQTELGVLPSYEAGLVKLAGGGNNPVVADFSTVSPFATTGQLAQLPEYGTLASFLNPVYGAAVETGMRQNQYGQHSNNPLGDALSSVFAPTPEAQILNAYLHPSKPTAMFHKTPWNMLARAAAGASLPRRINLAAARSAAARERAGR